LIGKHLASGAATIRAGANAQTSIAFKIMSTNTFRCSTGGMKRLRLVYRSDTQQGCAVCSSHVIASFSLCGAVHQPKRR